MRRRLLAALRLIRGGGLLSAAGDVVASLAVLGVPWGSDPVRATIASALLYAAGMTWNDFADRRLDAEIRPERPIPRGDATPGFAAALGLGLLGAGLAVSPCREFHIGLAGLILAYDFLLKRIDWLGVLVMASLRGLNLSTAFALVGFDPADPSQRPLLVAALCYAVYVAAITVLGLYEDRPNVSPRAVAAVLGAPPVAALCGLFVVQGGLWPAPLLATPPILWFARQNSRARSFDAGSIRVAVTRLLLGTLVYAALLCSAADRWLEALSLLAVIVPARLLSRFAALA